MSKSMTTYKYLILIYKKKQRFTTLAQFTTQSNLLCED